MDIQTRLSALLSRKFLSPIIGIASFFVWKSFLPSIPIDIYATFTGVLFGSFLTLEGIRDIILALNSSSAPKSD